MTQPEPRRHDTEEMLRAELGHVRGATPTQPDVYAAARSLELNALCFSGGGIRSASFCLGVAQALAGKHLLPRFDYLSTVSGGGYIGGWLQRLLTEEKGTSEARVSELARMLRQPRGRGP